MIQRNLNADAFEFAGGEKGVLLLHGFSGTPAEVRDLGARLHRLGYGVSGPILPGHSGEPRELEAIGVGDYLRAAEVAFDALRERHRVVHVVGFSMGGALGLYLAQNRQLDALVTINAPLEMPAHVQRSVPFVAKYAANAPLPVNPRALFGHPGYPAMPAHSVATFLDVLEYVRAGLAHLACPLLVLQGASDETVPASNADAIVRGSGSHARSIIVPDAPHLMTMGRWLDTIEPFIARFLADADRGVARDGRNSAELS